MSVAVVLSRITRVIPVSPAPYPLADLRIRPHFDHGPWAGQGKTQSRLGDRKYPAGQYLLTAITPKSIAGKKARNPARRRRATRRVPPPTTRALRTSPSAGRKDI